MKTGIDLRHLRHFIALAEELHFGRAALRCNISQPPFSVSIRQLEDSLGFALVERNTHEVRLTPAGAAFHQEAGKVVTQFDRAHITATRVHQGLQGTLDVGFMGSMLYRGLDRAVAAFRSAHPDVALRLVELSTSDQLPALLRHRIDYAFVHSATLPDVVESEELTREPFVLCVPASHPAAGQSNIQLRDFSGEAFVLFSRSYSPTYYDQVISICVSAGFHPRIEHEARHWLTVLALVSKGMGITLVPRSLATFGLPTIAFVKIDDHAVRSFVRGVWLKSANRDPALQAWHRSVQQEIKGEE